MLGTMLAVAVAAAAAAEDAAPAWVSYTSLAVSLLAIVATLLWGWWTWRREGEVIAVDADLRPRLWQTAARRPLRTAQAVDALTITVKNKGRHPVDVHLVEFTQGSTRSLVSMTPDHSTLPITIGARSRKQWFVDTGSLGVMTKNHGNPLRVRPQVEYGPGRIKRGPKLRIWVGDDALPGHGEPFSPSRWDRIRFRFAPRQFGLREPQAGEGKVSVRPQQKEAGPAPPDAVPPK